MKKIYISHGEKGGCGKSMTALMALETLHAKFGPAALVAVETDASNPDFGRKAQRLEGLRVEVADLREAEGWGDLANMVEGAPDDSAFVVNLPSQVARWDAEIEVMGDVFEALGAEVTVFWTINRQRDSILLLEKAMASAPSSWRWIVVKNCYFGAPEKFELFDIFNLELGKKALKTINVPECDDILVLTIMTNPVAFSTVETAAETFTTHQRSKAKRFLQAAQKEFSPVL